MADQRITQLTQLVEADVAATDVLPIVDISATETKKVTAKDLFEAGATLADSSSIDLIKLNQSSTTKIGTTALADDAVTGAKLANDSSIVYDSIAPASDNFEGRGYVNSTSKNLQVWDGSAFQQVVAPTAGIENLAVTTGKLADNAVTTAKVDASGLAAAALATDAVITAKIQNLAVTTGKLADGAVTTAKIAVDAVTAAELASDAVVTASIVDANVTEAKLASGAVTEAKIGTGAVTVTKVADASLTYAKLNLADGSIPGAKLATGGVTSTQLAADAVTTGAITNLNVTTGKLADGAVTAVKIADGVITTAKIDAAGLGAAALASNAVTTAKVQDAAITGAKMADDSTTIVTAGTPTGIGDFEGQEWFNTTTAIKYVWDGSAWVRQAALNTISFSDSTPLAFSVAYPDNFSATVTTTLDTQAANRVLVGPTTGADAAPTFRALTPADLPDATSSTKGIIQPGTGLAVNAGVLNHSNSVTGGTYTKVTVDSQGHVSAGALIEAADVPSLDASKITTGTFAAARLASDAVTAAKLADYSTAQIGEALPTADYIGQLFFNPLDKNIYLWDGNVWQPVGVSLGELIFAGTYNASTNEIATTTTTGAAVGLVVGDPLPTASSTYTSYYVVVATAGTGTAPAPVEALSPPDIILCDGTAWTQIDVSSTYVAQSAINVGFTPAGTISATNVQAAVEEVASEAANASNLTSGSVGAARGGTGNTSYTKGDLLAASASTTLSKLGVGTNGQVLRANSATATGLEWGADFVGTVTSVSGSGAISVANGTTTPAISVAAASTSVVGVVQLSDSTSTTSSTVAATSTAVKSAYDLADAALAPADIGVTVQGYDADTAKLDVAQSWSAAQTFNAALVFNENGADIDLRMEGDTNTHLFFLDASTDRLGINQSAPATKLDISGNYGQNIVAVSALDIDCSAGNYFTKTINGASTFTVSSVPASRSFSFVLELEHTSGTITWFSGVEWPGGTAPTLTTGKTHFFIFHTDNGGTRWRASSLINYTT